MDLGLPPISVVVAVLIGTGLIVSTIIVMGLKVRRAILDAAKQQISAQQQLEHDRFSPEGLQRYSEQLRQYEETLTNLPLTAHRLAVATAMTLTLENVLAQLQGSLEFLARQLVLCENSRARYGGQEAPIARIKGQMSAITALMNKYVVLHDNAVRIAQELRPH